MTFSSSNTTEPRTDALEEAPFDPDARQVDRAGLSYVDFHAVLCGEPDPGDPVNEKVQRYLKQGRSEAFCREYRAGYEGALRSVAAVEREGRFDAQDLARSRWAVAHRAGETRANEAFPGPTTPTPRFRFAAAQASRPDDFGVIRLSTVC